MGKEGEVSSRREQIVGLASKVVLSKPVLAAESKILGVQLEDWKFLNPTYVAVELAFRATLRGIEVQALGDMPTDGGALVVSNHPSTKSAFLVPYAVQQLVRRPTVMVVRDTLLNPDIEEEPEVIERTGSKKDIFNSKNPLIRKPITAVINRSVSPIPIHRGKPERSTFRSINASIARGRVVGMFLQETRTPEDDLTNAMEGIATLMWNNPNVPIYLLGMSGISKESGETKSPKLVLDTPFTYAGITKESRMSRDDIQKYVVQRMANLLRPDVPNVRTKYDLTSGV